MAQMFRPWLTGQKIYVQKISVPIWTAEDFTTYLLCSGIRSIDRLIARQVLQWLLHSRAACKYRHFQCLNTTFTELGDLQIVEMIWSQCNYNFCKSAKICTRIQFKRNKIDEASAFRLSRMLQFANSICETPSSVNLPGSYFLTSSQLFSSTLKAY